jgi:K+-transporting ATPase ATPase C chain
MKELKMSIIIIIIFTGLTGIIYPLFITGAGMILFPDKSRGSLIRVDGSVTGSELIGQEFRSPGFFHGRPSSGGYDASLSGGGNLAPGNPALIELIMERAAKARNENGLAPSAKLPGDMVFSSGSGLDPHISRESALLQAPRVSAANSIDMAALLSIIDSCAERQLYVAGMEYVNVLKLNMAIMKKGEMQ